MSDPLPAVDEQIIAATFPQYDFPADLLGAVLRAASNGLTYQLTFELPVSAHEAVVQIPNSITLWWGSKDEIDGDPRLIGSAELASSKTAPDADGMYRHKVVYKLPQDQVLTGIGVVAACLATDNTKGRLFVRAEQAQFDLTERA